MKAQRDFNRALQGEKLSNGAIHEKAQPLSCASIKRSHYIDGPYKGSGERSYPRSLARKISAGWVKRFASNFHQPYESFSSENLSQNWFWE
jgi:hypothetical protein